MSNINDPTVHRKRIVYLVVSLLVVFGLYGILTVNVPPHSFAVSQVLLGPNKGIQEKTLGPGLQLVMPTYERLHIFSRRMQLIELNDNLNSTSSLSKFAPSIRIQTSEGYEVTVDVTVSYRIIDPYKVITQIGPGRLYETALVRPRADRFLRQSLGRLNAEDFYNGTKRRRAAQEARNKLSEELTPAGIQVWDVLVRHYTYDQRYQNAIEQRKIQDQTVFKNQAEAIAQTEEAEKNRVLAEGNAFVNVEVERGKAEVRKIKAEADLYYRSAIAKGNLEVALAEAKGIKLENEALEVKGANNIVGLEMAKAIDGTQVIVLPTDGENGVNPLNLNALTEGW